MNEYEKSKSTSATSCMVCSKSFSVSPGKPTIKSELIKISGTAAFSLRMRDLYSSAVWLRFIADKMRSEPDCTGKCKYFARLEYWRGHQSASQKTLADARSCNECDQYRRLPPPSAAVQQNQQSHHYWSRRGSR